MKILHIIDSAGIYGAEVMLLNLMLEQVKLGLRPVLLSIESELEIADNELVKAAAGLGLNVTRINLHRGYNRDDAYEIIEYAKAGGFDIIHSHGYKSNILLGFLSVKCRVIPVVVTAHGWTSVRVFTRIWLYSLLDKLAIRRLDAVAYVNPLSKNVIRHKKSYIVENGIPVIDFSIINNTDECLLRRDKHEFIIGTILRLSEEKGVIYLLEAAKQLIADGYNIKVVIIGDGPLRAEFQSYISNNNMENTIHLLGYRSNANRYLKSFDIFVLPSLTEGLPITMLEAMQSETPIIATKVGAIPYVLDYGKYGVIVNHSSSTELVNSIKESINNRHKFQEVAKMAKQHVIEKYSSHKMATKYLDLYKRVLHK